MSQDQITWQIIHDEYVSYLATYKEKLKSEEPVMLLDPATDLYVEDVYDKPLRKALDILSGRWKVPILFEIFNSNPIRFNTLKKNLDGISVSMLSVSLKELVDEGLVDRTQYNEIPLRVEYSLTRKGISLFRILMDLSRWEDNFG